MRIGIDIGGTSVTCALVRDDCSIVAQETIATEKNRPYQAVLLDVGRLATRVLEASGEAIADVEAVGVGCPGIIDQKKGTVIYSNNIAWENVPIVEELQKHFACKIYVDNDANCAALGEYICGAAKGYSNSVTITLGTGVGAGIIIGGRPLSEFNSAACALGHTVIVSGGERCTCGRRGCWESYASVTALIRMANQETENHPASQLAKARKLYGSFDGKNIFDTAKAGDPVALNLLNRYYFYVSEGIVDIINILQPEVIVIGGGLSREGEYLLRPIEELVRKEVYCKQLPLPKLRIAQLNNNAGVIGAAYLGCGAKNL